MFKKNLSYLLITVIALSLILIANGLILAWAPPTANPPSGNTLAPLNVSNVAQTKLGGLDIGGVLNMSAGTKVENNITAINALVGYNDLFIQGNQQQTASIYYGALAHSFFTPGSSDERVYIAPSGNVGIGTNMPSERLDVAGTVKATKFIGDGSGLTGVVGGGGGGGVTDHGLLNAASLLDDDHPQYLLTNGTRAMSGALKMSAGGENDITAIDELVGYNDLFIKGNQQGTAMIYYSALEHEFYTNGVEKVVILNNGNVGIGTVAPGAKLDVAGTIKIADGTQAAGRVLTSDASGLASWQAPVGGGGGGIGGSGGDNYIPRWNGASALENSMIYQTDANNVGIGTLAPSEKLEISNSTRSMVSIKGNTNADWVGTAIKDPAGNEKWFIGSNNNQLLLRRSGTTNDLVIDINGNVGIGTGALAPGAKLDVAGTVRATKFIGDGSQLTGIAGGGGGGGPEVDGVIGNEVVGAGNTTLTLSGSGTAAAPYKLALNLANANTWSGIQTFSSNTNFPGGIWASGSVSIGTIAVPSEKLEVATNDRSVLSLKGDTNANWVGIAVKDATGGMEKWYMGAYANDFIIRRDGKADYLKISASGDSKISGSLDVGGGLPYYLTKNGDSFALKNNAGEENFILGQDGSAFLRGGLSVFGDLNTSGGLNISGDINKIGDVYQYNYDSTVGGAKTPRCECDTNNFSVDCQDTFMSSPSAPAVCYDQYWWLFQNKSRKFISAKSVQNILSISSDPTKPTLAVKGNTDITGNVNIMGSMNVVNDLTVTGNFTDNRCSWVLLASGSDITEEAQITGDFKNGSVDMSNTVTYYNIAGQKININSIAKIAHPEMIRSIAFEAGNPEDSFCMGGTGDIRLGVNGINDSGSNTKCTRTQYNGKTYNLEGVDEVDWIKLTLEDINGWQEQVSCYSPSMKDKFQNNSATYGGTYIGGFENPATNPTSHGVTGMCQSFYKLFDGSVSYSEFDNLTGKFKVEETDHSPYYGVWNWKIWGNYCNYQKEAESGVLFSGKHFFSDCTNMGGAVITDWERNDWFCRLSGSACPAGWTNYTSVSGQLWSATTAVTCNGTGGCANCTTASHSWSAKNSEICAYGLRQVEWDEVFGWDDWCETISGCTATRTEIGCY